MLCMLVFCFCFLDDLLMVAQQVFGKETYSDLERQTTTVCSLKGKNYVFDFTLCAIITEVSCPHTLFVLVAYRFGNPNPNPDCGRGFVIVVYGASV